MYSLNIDTIMTVLNLHEPNFFIMRNSISCDLKRKFCSICGKLVLITDSGQVEPEHLRKCKENTTFSPVANGISFTYFSISHYRKYLFRDF